MMTLSKVSDEKLIEFICKCDRKSPSLLKITDTYELSENSKLIILHPSGNVYKDENIINPNDRYIIEVSDEQGIRMVGKLSDRLPIKIVTELPKDMEVFHSLKDGTHIRMYKINGKIFLSSNKKIDINNSYWDTDITFGEMLNDAIKEMKIKLEVSDNICYHLILCHPFNQLINKDKVKPKIYHISSFVFGKWSKKVLEDMTPISLNPSIFPQLERILYKTAKNNLFVDNKPVLYTNPDGNKIILITKKIEELYKLRGENIPDVYIEYMKNLEKGKGKDYIAILPYSYQQLHIDEYIEKLYTDYYKVVADIIENDNMKVYIDKLSKKKSELLQIHIDRLKPKIDDLDAIGFEYKNIITKLDAYKVMKNTAF